MMKRSGALSVCLLLFGSACTTGYSRPSAEMTAFDNTNATPPVVGTEIAGPGTMLQPLPTGVLLLTEPKDGAGFERNMAVCEAFFRTLPTTQELRWQSPTVANIVATRWLNSQSTVPSTDCGHLVNQYDYPRAARLIAEIHAEGRGPFFAGFLAGSYIAVDGSTYETDKLGDFVGQWAKVIIKANKDYAELARKREADLERRESDTSFAERGLPGPILIVYGIFKTAVQAFFGTAEIIFGFV